MDTEADVEKQIVKHRPKNQSTNIEQQTREFRNCKTVRDCTYDRIILQFPRQLFSLLFDTDSVIKLC